MSPRSGFYPEELTRKSLEVLAVLGELVPDAILIGGWAIWLRVGEDMSHDIDLIVDHAGRDAVWAIAEPDVRNASSHFRGRKWRATIDSIHVDLYVPFESVLGTVLQLRVEALVPFADGLDGHRVLDAPAHTATKLAALLDRPETEPGTRTASSCARW
ncbi:MAG: hypothetical protein ACYCTE_10820 [Acidimicrobiales bacterium]